MSSLELRLPDDHRVLLAMIRAAVVGNDADRLRQILFEREPWFDGSRERRVLRPGVAIALREGFDLSAHRQSALGNSVAELCFVYQRDAMLREVLECARPAAVAGTPTADVSGWVRSLCTGKDGRAYVSMPLPHVATRHLGPQSRAFIMLALEFADPMEVDALKFVRHGNPELMSLIAECEMAMRILRATKPVSAPAGANRPGDSENAARARRMSL